MRRLVLMMVLLPALAGCSNVFFQPWRGQLMTPDQVGIAYQDVYFNAADGTRLHGWFLPAHQAPIGTILHLHGNAENISTHFGAVFWLPERGFNVFLLDYRGYGLSGGEPSLPGAQDDITSALAMLLTRPDVDPDRIVVFGQSLGGALAIYNVAHSPYRSRIRALAVESAFSDYRDIAREKLDGLWLTWPFQYPLSWTVRDDYSPLPAVSKISPIPLLIMHGDQDLVVPIAHGQRLYAAARDPKQFWRVEGAGHIGAFRFLPWRDRFVDYLKDVLKTGARDEGKGG